jgi:hypothetical protein
MNGIEIGYLKVSPFAALTPAIIIQTILSMARNTIMGIPIIMKQRGIARIV